VLCCVGPRLALHPFSRLIDVSLSRWASFCVPPRFIAGLPQNLPVCALPLPGLARPLVRDSATPRPLVPSVAQLLTQLDTSVRWEDVPISSTGSSFNTHPFVLLLTLISPLSYGGRETVFEPFERSMRVDLCTVLLYRCTLRNMQYPIGASGIRSRDTGHRGEKR
jgi:hypothetical protein